MTRHTQTVVISVSGKFQLTECVRENIRAPEIMWMTNKSVKRNSCSTRLTVSVSLWAHLNSFRVFCKNYDVCSSGFTSLSQSRSCISYIYDSVEIYFGKYIRTLFVDRGIFLLLSPCKQVQINPRLVKETPCKHTNAHSHLLSRWSLDRIMMSELVKGDVQLF